MDTEKDGIAASTNEEFERNFNASNGGSNNQIEITQKLHLKLASRMGTTAGLSDGDRIRKQLKKREIQTYLLGAMICFGNAVHVMR